MNLGGKISFLIGLSALFMSCIFVPVYNKIYGFLGYEFVWHTYRQTYTGLVMYHIDFLRIFLEFIAITAATMIIYIFLSLGEKPKMSEEKNNNNVNTAI